jgi:G3E family GTPase
VEQDQIEHVERIDRTDALDERGLAVAVERLQREAARVDLASFAHELLDLRVEVEVPRERLVAELRKAALHAERHARPVEQDGRLETFAFQAHRLQQVHEPDRAFEGHRVERDQGFFPWFGLHVLEDLLLVVDQEVTGFVRSELDLGHWISPSGSKRRRERAG